MLQLFECLLPLLPNIDLAIHMIGDKIAADIPSKQRIVLLHSVPNNSSIFITTSTCLYGQSHIDGTGYPKELSDKSLKPQNLGTGKPDMIIALNAGLVTQKEWAPAIARIAKSGIKFLVTERMEQLCNAAQINLPTLNAKITVSPHLNPFRQPLFDFKKDVNLPGWSNGFIFGMGDF